MIALQDLPPLQTLLLCNVYSITNTKKQNFSPSNTIQQKSTTKFYTFNTKHSTFYLPCKTNITNIWLLFSQDHAYDYKQSHDKSFLCIDLINKLSPTHDWVLEPWKTPHWYQQFLTMLQYPKIFHHIPQPSKKTFQIQIWYYNKNSNYLAQYNCSSNLNIIFL